MGCMNNGYMYGFLEAMYFMRMLIQARHTTKRVRERAMQNVCRHRCGRRQPVIYTLRRVHKEFREQWFGWVAASVR